MLEDIMLLLHELMEGLKAAAAGEQDSGLPAGWKKVLLTPWLLHIS